MNEPAGGPNRQGLNRQEHGAVSILILVNEPAGVYEDRDAKAASMVSILILVNEPAGARGTVLRASVASSSLNSYSGE